MTMQQSSSAAHISWVIGKPVAHSLSPVLHRAAYADLGLDDWAYEAREVAPEDLRALLEEVAAPAAEGPVPVGLSVTMPHKQLMMPMLDVIDPLAVTVGAANTVVAQRAGRGRALLAGFNTDVAGIVGALRETAPALVGRDRGLSALVLGSGATACSSLAALTELGATRIAVAARRHAGPGRALTAAHRMGLEVEALTWRPGEPESDALVAALAAEAQLIVSTLPAGAADGVAAALGDELACRGGAAGGTDGSVLLDVVYAPWPSRLASVWREAGGAIAPGWLMLLHQAVPQVRLMTGMEPRVEPMRAALLAELEARAAS